MHKKFLELIGGIILFVSFLIQVWYVFTFIIDKPPEILKPRVVVWGGLLLVYFLGAFMHFLPKQGVKGALTEIFSIIISGASMGLTTALF